MIGALICRFKGHVWRRFRKGESSYIPAEQVPFDPKSHRVCNRCGAVRQVKARKAKAAT